MDEDDLRDRVEAMAENDILGVPMTMRIGVRFGPSPDRTDDNEVQLAEHIKGLVEFAAGEMAIFHFDTCPLGRHAVAPAALAEALAGVGVDSRLRTMEP